ncbi:hypothetical protein INT43_001992 [Umbelopsis isabellina]|uniref:Uncharacterized protein n=1 Tax=Mortierella isabellina TaxID=91625 RepID=A0A8H7PRV7_MORIS|nr:hypothetical protein INT43_001992 [Umbelopsis isabellina]
MELGKRIPSAAWRLQTKATLSAHDFCRSALCSLTLHTGIWSMSIFYKTEFKLTHITSSDQHNHAFQSIIRNYSETDDDAIEFSDTRKTPRAKKVEKWQIFAVFGMLTIPVNISSRD